MTIDGKKVVSVSYTLYTPSKITGEDTLVEKTEAESPLFDEDLSPRARLKGTDVISSRDTVFVDRIGWHWI